MAAYISHVYHMSVYEIEQLGYPDFVRMYNSAVSFLSEVISAPYGITASKKYEPPQGDKPDIAGFKARFPQAFRGGL